MEENRLCGRLCAVWNRVSCVEVCRLCGNIELCVIECATWNRVSYMEYIELYGRE